MWSWIKKKLFGSRSKPILSTSESAQSRDSEAQSYSTDQPIRSAVNDRFGRSPFAKRVADTISTRHDPSSLVIGLYGPWGDGKTSVLFMLEEQLRTYPNIIAVRFNPWHFGTESQLLQGFFSTLASALGKELHTQGEKLGQVLKDYGALLSVGSVAFAGGLVQLNPGQAAKEIGDSLSTVNLDTQYDRIEKLLSQSGRHVVVLIDDIDRLDKDETHAIFKLAKLSAGFKHTSYVLAFDDEVVAAALGERYGAGGDSAGRAFLEKIVQVPLHLPPADSMALRKMALEGVDNALKLADIDLTQADIDAYIRQFVDGVEMQMSTPRQARLYGNALMFALPLVKGEVNIVDMLLIEGVRIFYPKLYTAIRDNKNIFLEQKDNREQQAARDERLDLFLKDGAPNLTSSEKQTLKARLLAYLFPRLSNVGYGGDWDHRWATEQRVCSQGYFDRYFTYGVPPSDVSDNELDFFAETLTTLNLDQQDAAIAKFAINAPALVIKKLRQREESISVDKIQALCLTVARNGALFPCERGPFVMGGTQAQAAILVAHLLRRIPDLEVRANLASDIAAHAEPLIFATECLRWMEPGRDDVPETWWITRDVLDRLNQVVANRIKASDHNRPLYLEFPRDARALYWQWAKIDADDVKAVLRQHFLDEPNDVDLFLDRYVGEAWGLESGLPTRSDFDRRDYDAICRIADPAEIAKSLVERFGVELNSPTYHHDDKQISLPLRIAHQFMVIHNAAIEPTPQSDQPLNPA